jgi:hypothetical protein
MRTRRSLIRRSFASVLACAMLVASVTAGTRYVWCVPMQRAQMHCCCHGRWLTPEHRAQPAIETHCCDGRRIESAPPTSPSLASMNAIAPAPLVSVLALADLYPARDAVAPARIVARQERARDGPRIPIYLADRSLLN